jgi:hypothetical protein
MMICSTSPARYKQYAEIAEGTITLLALRSHQKAFSARPEPRILQYARCQICDKTILGICSM